MILLQGILRIANSASNKAMNSSVYIGIMYGDGSPLIHIQSNQTFYMEYQKATSKRSNPKVNFLIEEHGDLITVNDLRISGDKTPPVDLRGSIRGVTKLTLSANKVCQIRRTASISVELQRDNSSAVAINLGQLTLEYGAGLSFSHGGELDIGYLTMRQRSFLSADDFEIKSTAILIEGEGNIKTTARSKEKGPGSGSEAGGSGSGAGHGGYGGGHNVSGGGEPYGSYTLPTHPGSKGGGNSGGFGGSVIKVKQKLESSWQLSWA